MRHRFTIFAIFMLMLAAALFAGCNSSSGNDDEDTGNVSGAASSYLPFKLNATWNYTETSSYDGQQASTSQSTSKVIGSMTLNGKSYWMMEDATKYGDNYSWADTTLFRVEGNVLYSFPNQGMLLPVQAKAAAAKPARAALSLLNVQGSEVAWLKFGVAVNTTWAMYNSGVVAGNSVVVTGKYVGLENVTVPAGTYSGCAKFEITSVFTFKDAQSGLSGKSTGTNTLWFAPGVGPVKITDVWSSTHDGKTFTDATTSVLTSVAGL